MSLLPVAYPAHETIRCVRFATLDITALVDVLVTHAALHRIEASGPASATYLARFEKHRDKFEQIASSKRQRGQVEMGGAVIVEAADLNLIN